MQNRTTRRVGRGTTRSGPACAIEGGGSPIEIGIATIEAGVGTIQDGTTSIEVGAPPMEIGVLTNTLGVARIAVGVGAIQDGTTSIEIGAPPNQIGSLATMIGDPPIVIGAPALATGGWTLPGGGPARGTGGRPILGGDRTIGAGDPATLIGRRGRPRRRRRRRCGLRARRGRAHHARMIGRPPSELRASAGLVVTASLGAVALALVVAGAVVEPDPVDVSVEELTAAPTRFVGRRVVVRGTVAPGSLLRTGPRKEPPVQFPIAGGGREIFASSDRVAPDTLWERNEGIFKGTLWPGSSGWRLHLSQLVLKTGRRPRGVPTWSDLPQMPPSWRW